MEFAKWVKNLTPSAMQKSLEFNNISDYISFALGLPDETMLPADFCSSLKITQQDLQYSPTNNLLKSHLTKIMKLRGVKCNEENIFITNGAQQGISLLTRLLSDEGDSALVENLSYPGFVQAAQTSKINLIPVSTNYEYGICLEDLEKQILSLNRKPRFIYIVADGSNPTGNSLTIRKRQELINISLKYNIPILEDDPYGLLYYEQNFPSLSSFSKNNVCYIGSFSKVMAPSLRVGWVVVPSQLINKIAILKESLDINTQTLSQKIVLAFLESGKFEKHLKDIRSLYRKKRDVMINSIHHCLKDKVTFYKPNNGLYIWMRFNDEINYKNIFIKAMKNKILFIPGNDFRVKNNLIIGNDCARFNFTHCSVEEINKGIKILSAILNE